MLFSNSKRRAFWWQQSGAQFLKPKRERRHQNFNCWTVVVLLYEEGYCNDNIIITIRNSSLRPMNKWDDCPCMNILAGPSKKGIREVNFPVLINWGIKRENDQSFNGIKCKCHWTGIRIRIFVYRSKTTLGEWLHVFICFLLTSMFCICPTYSLLLLSIRITQCL